DVGAAGEQVVVLVLRIGKAGLVIACLIKDYVFVKVVRIDIVVATCRGAVRAYVDGCVAVGAIACDDVVARGERAIYVDGTTGRSRAIVRQGVVPESDHAGAPQGAAEAAGLVVVEQVADGLERTALCRIDSGGGVRAVVGEHVAFQQQILGV